MCPYRKILSLLLALLLTGASLAALPEGSEPEAEQASAAERGREALLDTGHASYLQFPEDEDYLSEWKTLYARKAFHAPSLEVKSVPDMQDSTHPNMPYLYEGTAVTVVAEQGDMSCFVYRGANNKPYCGWLSTIRLLDDFPGETLVSGTENISHVAATKDPEITWGEWGFQRFWHDFSSLSKPVEKCVGFTLEYQLIAENTDIWSYIYGPRSIWVNTGESWVEVGSFEYPKKGAVRVQVWLPQPMTVAAVGTVAHCLEPETFSFRQTAYDFCVAADGRENVDMT